MRKFVSRVISSFLPTVLICTAALAASSSDSWVTGGPADQHWSDTSVVITPDRIIDLPLTARAKALSMLETKSIVSLDPISYLDLLPSKGYPADADRLPYLVRGVALNDPGSSGSLARVEQRDHLAVVRAAEVCPGECIFIELDEPAAGTENA